MSVVFMFLVLVCSLALSLVMLLVFRAPLPARRESARGRPCASQKTPNT